MRALLPLLLLAGCASLTRPVEARAVAERPRSPGPAAPAVVDAGPPVVAVEVDAGDAGVPRGALAVEEADTEATGGEEPGEAEAGEAPGEPGDVATGPADAGFLYTADLTDEALAEAWRRDPASLGSISMGFVEEGRLVNGVPFPKGDGWVVVSPEATWGTRETVDFVVAALRQVKAWYPEAPPLRVNQISAPEGGFLRPHKTHQNGRDVDLGFYYPRGETIRVRERERVIDVEKNWALVKALVMHGDVQFILVDQRIQKVLYEHALRAGEDRTWLDSLFHAGRASTLQHARRHRDHFHVRFFNARAQELGRRVAPLTSQRPEQNLALHRVRRGDTLGSVAARYGSSVAAIKRASGLTTNLLRLGRVLKVPLRKPCTSCPVPPPTWVPPRRLPPPALAQQAPGAPTSGRATPDAGVDVAGTAVMAAPGSQR
ncbi:MAG: penicillin-insensitive murein endopeptidase [Myxococcaceae bacterium]|nr:penicillin-insensitive murein endopeptidase [Myxococcaceae bacterium]MCA3013143.1 penicillin-insensitive murein endopeptidase [Myxococcaceae bacterium]